MKRDFLAIADYSAEEIKEMLDLALDLKKEYFEKGKSAHSFRQGPGDDLQ